MRETWKRDGFEGVGGVGGFGGRMLAVFDGGDVEIVAEDRVLGFQRFDELRVRRDGRKRTEEIVMHWMSGVSRYFCCKREWFVRITVWIS